MSNILIQLEDDNGNKLFPLTPSASSFFTDVECKNAFIKKLKRVVKTYHLSKILNEIEWEFN